MKSIFSLVVIIALVSTVNCETFSLFNKFITENNKQYAGEEEYIRRFQIFNENVKLVDQLNSQSGETAEYAINQFADLSAEEFVSTMLMPSREAPYHSWDEFLPNVDASNIPASFNWATNSSVVSPVFNQGSGGTCWAVSTCGNIEGRWALSGHTMKQLSVEQFIECDSTQDPSSTSMNADCGVFGGWPYLAMQYVIKNGGLASNADYPDCSGISPATCLPCSPHGYNYTRCGPEINGTMCDHTVKCKEHKFPMAAKIHSWKRVSTDETQIAAEVLNGPLSVALDATMLQFYKKGIFKPALGCNPTKLNHAVLITGYGEEGSKPFWNVKNSWGPKWGENGYFRIARGVGECGINTEVVTAIV